jgi:hypothetical protein
VAEAIVAAQSELKKHIGKRDDYPLVQEIELMTYGTRIDKWYYDISFGPFSETHVVVLMSGEAAPLVELNGMDLASDMFLLSESTSNIAPIQDDLEAANVSTCMDMMNVPVCDTDSIGLPKEQPNLPLSVTQAIVLAHNALQGKKCVDYNIVSVQLRSIRGSWHYVISAMEKPRQVDSPSCVWHRVAVFMSGTVRILANDQSGQRGCSLPLDN